MKSRNRDVASAGHHRERLKSSPRPARGKFPSGDVPPRGRPSVLPGAQGGASGWGLRVGPLGGLRGPARAQSPLGSHPRVFSGSICAARFSFDTAPKFSCAPRSEKSEVPPEPPRGPRAGGPEPFPPPGAGPAGGTARPFLAPPAGEGVRRGPRAPRAGKIVFLPRRRPRTSPRAAGRWFLPPPGGGGAGPSPGARAPPRRPPRARGRGGGGSPREVAAGRRARGPACAPANPRCAGEGASRPAGEELRRGVCLRAGAEMCGPGPRRRRPGRAGPGRSLRCLGRARSPPALSEGGGGEEERICGMCW